MDGVSTYQPLRHAGYFFMKRNNVIPDTTCATSSAASHEYTESKIATGWTWHTGLRNHDMTTCGSTTKIRTSERGRWRQTTEQVRTIKGHSSIVSTATQKQQFFTSSSSRTGSSKTENHATTQAIAKIGSYGQSVSLVTTMRNTYQQGQVRLRINIMNVASRYEALRVFYSERPLESNYSNSVPGTSTVYLGMMYHFDIVALGTCTCIPAGISYDSTNTNLKSSSVHTFGTSDRGTARLASTLRLSTMCCSTESAASTLAVFMYVMNPKPLDRRDTASFITIASATEPNCSK